MATWNHLPPLLHLHDLAPEQPHFYAEVLAGLQQPRKELPCKFFYDAHGSHLFDQICELEEYYPTRTEIAIMEQSIHEMAAVCGEECLLIEYGSGNSRKSRLLLDALPAPVAYLPIDISRTHLMVAAQAVAAAYPEIEVLPVCADYTQPLDLPLPRRDSARRIVYYPGSTIGNFHPDEAAHFLQIIADLCGPGGGLLIGVDLKKDPEILHHAYNDSQGVTAAFNLNLLTRINRELGADFQPDQYRHYAFYNPTQSRIEMHLASLAAQEVRLGGVRIPFARGETIWTESSYKYSLHDFEHLASRAGLSVEQIWMDPHALFSVQYLVVP